MEHDTSVFDHGRVSTPSLTDRSFMNEESGANTPHVQRPGIMQTSSKKRVTETDPFVDSYDSPKRPRVGRGAWVLEDDSSEEEM